MNEFGLLGERLGHSFSPQIHAKLGNYPYHLYSVPPSSLHDFMVRSDFRGLNVTIPYKKDVLPYLDTLSDRASQIGSVNTIVKLPDGRLAGDNTDYFGFSHLAESAGISFKDRIVLILGSGGTCATAKAVAQDEGARSVRVVSRTGELNYQTVHERCPDAQIIVNTTPVGMSPNNDQSPIDLARFPALCGVIDVIYNPLTTRLLAQAQALHVPCTGGLPMLVAQAKAASELFQNRALDDGVIARITADLQREQQNVVLIGMPGSGKSTIGKHLATLLGRPFADLDELIVARTGKSIPEIFAGQGEEAFRDLESGLCRELGAQNGRVISVGGGAVLREPNRIALAQNALIVYLRQPLDQLDLEGRPLSKNMATLERIYRERAPLYEALSDAQIHNDHEKSPANVAAQIREELAL